MSKLKRRVRQLEREVVRLRYVIEGQPWVACAKCGFVFKRTHAPSTTFTYGETGPIGFLCPKCAAPPALADPAPGVSP